MWMWKEQEYFVLLDFFLGVLFSLSGVHFLLLFFSSWESVDTHFPLFLLISFSIFSPSLFFIQADSQKIVPKAIEHPNDYVLKPQREGGGKQWEIFSEKIPGKNSMIGKEWFARTEKSVYFYFSIERVSWWMITFSRTASSSNKIISWKIFIGFESEVWFRILFRQFSDFRCFLFFQETICTQSNWSTRCRLSPPNSWKDVSEKK